ncbi:MAG: hypothetical protein WBO29_09360 [Albidovulum sp.]
MPSTKSLGQTALKADPRLGDIQWYDRLKFVTAEIGLLVTYVVASLAMPGQFQISILSVWHILALALALLVLWQAMSLIQFRMMRKNASERAHAAIAETRAAWSKSDADELRRIVVQVMDKNRAKRDRTDESGSGDGAAG